VLEEEPKRRKGEKVLAKQADRTRGKRKEAVGRWKESEEKEALHYV